MIICDTHVLVYDAISPEQLSSEAQEAITRASENGELACADISLWEIAMLIEKGRLKVSVTITDFLSTLSTARRLNVLPITPSIADISVSTAVPSGDPADRLIAATAIHYNVPLVTKDKRLLGLKGLNTIW